MKAKEKKCIIKRILRFNDYKNCLLNNETILKSKQRLHIMYILKFALSSTYDKRLQTFDKIT